MFGNERFFSKELKAALQASNEQCRKINERIMAADGAAQQILNAETISPEAIAEKARARFVRISATKEMIKALNDRLPLYAQAETDCEAEGNRIRTQVIPARQAELTQQLLGIGFTEKQIEQFRHMHPELIQLHETADSTWTIGTAESGLMRDRVVKQIGKLGIELRIAESTTVVDCVMMWWYLRVLS